MKVSVIVVVFNTPSFIKPQFDLLKKYLQNDFELFIYNNSNQETISQDIERECYDLRVKCIRVPQNIFDRNDPSYKAGKSLDYAIEHNITNYTNHTHMMILDSDMFLIKDFNILEQLDNFDVMGIHQERKHVFYYTNQLFFADLNKLKAKNFDKEIKFLPGTIEGQATDCGGYLFNYIKNYNISHCSIKNNIHSGQINYSNISNINESFIDYFKNEIDIMDGVSFAEYYGNCFLHFRAGTNWINFNDEVISKRSSILFEFLKNKLNI